MCWQASLCRYASGFAGTKVEDSPMDKMCLGYQSLPGPMEAGAQLLAFDSLIVDDFQSCSVESFFKSLNSRHLLLLRPKVSLVASLVAYLGV